MDKTVQGEFNHCGFIFAGTEDLFNDDLRGIPSYQALHDRLKPERGKRRTKDFRQPLIQLEGFDKPKLQEVGLKVRDVHAGAFGWQPALRLTDDLLTRLIEDTAARFGEKFKTVPRGFLKIVVDILDELEQNPQLSAADLFAASPYADRIEQVEQEEAHLLDRP